VKLSNGLVKFLENNKNKPVRIATKELPLSPLTGLLMGFDEDVILLNPSKEKSFEPLDTPIVIDLDSILMVYALTPESPESSNKTFNEFKQCSAEDYTAKGNELYGLGKFKESIEYYDKALKRYPQSGIAWYNKGLALKQLHRDAEANSAFIKAKELGYKG
jgi:tetratricopeptide (TPR) repeat protein